jgi:hypothetical protein
VRTVYLLALVASAWREVELSACCAAAASSSTFNCWHTHRSLEVAAFGQPRGSMAAAVRFCDARLKSGGVSASALALALVSTLAPSLAHRSLSRFVPVPAVSGHGPVAARQLGSARIARRSPRGVALAREHFV